MRLAIDALAEMGDPPSFTSREIVADCRAVGQFYSANEVIDVLDALVADGLLEASDSAWTFEPDARSSQTARVYRFKTSG